jgi:hypothetical protein
MTGRRLTWFAPNAGIWISQQMEHRVANALVDGGDDVLMVQCDGVLDAYCPVMSAAGLGADAPRSRRRAVCVDCRHAAGVTRARARYRTVQLGDLLPPGAFDRAEATVAAVTPDTWRDVVVDGVPVGLYSAYTALLHHKVPDVTSTDAAWREYLADLRGSLLVAEAMPALLEHGRPTHAVVYNALYPANRVFAETMRRHDVVLLNVSGGPTVPRRYSTMALYDGVTGSQTVVDSAAFGRSMTVPCSEVEVRAVEHHIALLMSGTDPWVYSRAATGRPAADIRADLGVRPDAPVVTVVVSSLDETRSFSLVDAVYERPGHGGFSSLTEFLTECVALAAAHPDVDFVFRLHPRLAPNRRDAITSPDLAAIRELLASLPPNAVINHPQDGMSLYDLVLVSEAAVNHSSSAGLEFLTFGVPVLQYDPSRSLLYPLEFSLPVERGDRRGMSDALDRALAAGFDLRRTLLAFRWYATLQVRSVVHLEPLPDPEAVEPPPSPHESHAAPHPLGRLVPTSLRERAARSLARRERAATVDDRPLPPGAAEALDGTIAAARLDREVWEPYLTLPDDPDAATEERAVRAAFARLLRRLDLVHPDGLGALRGARDLSRPEGS